MSYIFAVYTDQYYREYALPAIDNADYTLLLHAEELGLREDLRLKLEILDGSWQFLRSSGVQIFRGSQPFEGAALQPGLILRLVTRQGQRLALLVMENETALTPYQKFSLGSAASITVGKSPDNDLYDPNGAALSHHHLRITFRSRHAWVEDMSTNGTYLNHRRIAGRQMLSFGDEINLFGLSLIYLGNVLAVHTLKGTVQCSGGAVTRLSTAPVPEHTQKLPSLSSSETTIHLSPRNLPQIHNDEEVIEPVPAKQEDNHRPLWMSVLPSLTMMLPILVGYTLMNRGNMQMGLVITVGSAIVGFTWALINYRYARREMEDRELHRLERYEEYLVRCAQRIREKYEHNTTALLSMYPSAAACSRYTSQSVELWNRRPTHSDFLSLRIGLGDQPFQVKFRVPGKDFYLIDDELSERPRKIADSYRTLHNVPINVDLLRNSVVGIWGNGPQAGSAPALARLLMTQLAASHSYTDVKMALLYDESGDAAEAWEFARWLPHVWNESRTMRYLASDESQRDELIYALTQTFRSRAELLQEASFRSTRFQPHYVLFVEKASMLENKPLCKYLYEQGAALGVTTVILSQDYDSLPAACSLIVEDSADFHGIYRIQEGRDQGQSVTFDTLSHEEALRLSRWLCGCRVAETESSSDMPNSLTFFEMMGVHTLSELSVRSRWRKNRTYESMRTLIGQRSGGADCYLDIHEKQHGPHGLVAGTTGSGKSETLQTYILSLAVNYSPEDIGFFLIDFKGGGMSNLFSDLPHLVGQISNLSGNQVRRALVSIRSEKDRRQRIFNEYGVNHIDEYTRLFKARETSEPLPHLLIVIDEFAELKREQPEFMRELISISQVGRSLGIHLILATQKPSGTVDDNIRSNTKFKICLRVADRQDSSDMLHKPDAAYLTQPGRGYLQVGNDEIYELFQSGWSGATYEKDDSQQTERAVLIDLQGRETVSNRGRILRNARAEQEWIQEIGRCLRRAEAETGRSVTRRSDVPALAAAVVQLLNARETQYPDTVFNLRRMEELLLAWPKSSLLGTDAAANLIRAFHAAGRKLPERTRKTQLTAVTEYLAETARSCGITETHRLWLPDLPHHLALESLPGFSDMGTSRSSHRPGETALRVPVGLVDAPENQMQFPLTIDFSKGHLIVAGSVTSGKSTFLQTLFYALICGYTPAEVQLYGIDFSSQMLCAFEEDAHVGGIVVEGEQDRLNKLFGMLLSMLDERKQLLRGGSFSQYIRLHPGQLPAVVCAIDGYASFREKTESAFESQLLRLSREAENYGIYLVITCAGLGGMELQSKIADNMRQSVCLSLGDRYRYGEVLHISRFDTLPEEGVKGRGLVAMDGSVLEFQTALPSLAGNDYERSEWLRSQCRRKSLLWSGKKTRPIPQIPANPTWELFSTQEDYRAMLEQGSRLPVAYRQSDASLYSIDLSRTFCYLVLGRERTGKTNFLRNLACAAKDLGGKTVIIDRESGEERTFATQIGAEYAATSQELFNAVRSLILLTNERAPRRKALLGQGLSEEAAAAAMRREFSPVFYLIPDMNAFIQSVYTNLEGIGRLNSWIENIFAKGHLLNVYFFAAANVDQLTILSGRSAYNSFVRDRRGLLLGGEMNRQSLFSCANIRYSEQGQRLKVGMGHAANPDSEEAMELIVIPKANGGTVL